MRTQHGSKIVALAITGLALVACSQEPSEPTAADSGSETAPAPAASEPAASVATAVAVLKPTAATEGMSGTVTFSESEGSVQIVAHIEGAPVGPHGFHIHEVGDCSAADFTSAGGHFNPEGVDHAGPGDAVRHAGDLGNVVIGEDGMAHHELTSDLITLGEGENSVMGRAVILHQDADDLTSQPTGAAGARIACGVIAAADGDEDEMASDDEEQAAH